MERKKRCQRNNFNMTPTYYSYLSRLNAGMKNKQEESSIMNKNIQKRVDSRRKKNKKMKFSKRKTK